MKKLNWLFLSLMLFLGLGTAFAETEGEGDKPAPSITLPTPTFTPVDGSAVAPGTIVTVALPADIKNAPRYTYQGVVVIYIENNDEVDLLPDAATLSTASAEDMGMGGWIDDEEKPERLWKTATYDVEQYKMWMSNVVVSATEGTTKLRMRLATITYEDRNTVQFSEEFTATYTIDPDAESGRPAAPTFSLEDGKLYLKSEYIMTEAEIETLIQAKIDSGELTEEDAEAYAEELMAKSSLYSILYVVNGTDAVFDGITDVESFGAAKDNGTVSEYDSDKGEGIDYEAGQVIKAVTAEVIMAGMTDLKLVLSAVATYPEPPAAPVFNPNGGEVEPGTKVILTNGTENDETPLPIYYNFKVTGSEEFDKVKTQTQLTNALQPGLAGTSPKLTLYPAEGIEITKKTSVNAATARIDEEGNVSWSTVITKDFTIKAPEKPAAPVFNPNGGEVANGVPAITLTTDCDDCDIYYVINGSEENFYPEDYDELGSAEQQGTLTAYNGAIALTASASISAGAALVDEDGKITWSDIETQSFTVTGEAPETVATPVITPGNDATVHIGDLVTITCETEGAEIWYTANGKKPYTEDNSGINGISDDAVKYEAPFALTEDMLIKEGEAYALRIRAVAKNGNAYASASAGPNPYPDEPIPSVTAGEVLAGTKVSLRCVPSQADIYYSLDGTTPTMEEGTLYEGAIEITEDVTLKARAVLGQYQSSVVTAEYTITETTVELAFNPASGSEVEENTAVTITPSFANIDIFYMMFESEEAAKAAEWDQEQAELYTDEMQPVLSAEKNTVKAAYALPGADAIAEGFFYATYTVKELPAIDLIFNPASGSEVEENTEITVTATRETEILYNLYADKAAADADEVFVLNAKDVKEDGMPVITKGNTFLRCGVFDKGAMQYFDAEYTIKTANEDEELAGVTVYPNPSNGVFSLNLPVAASVEVFAINGVLMQHFNAKAGNTTLNINRSGIYFLRITGEGRTAIKRVIVR